MAADLWGSASRPADAQQGQNARVRNAKQEHLHALGAAAGSQPHNAYAAFHPARADAARGSRAPRPRGPRAARRAPSVPCSHPCSNMASVPHTLDLTNNLNALRRRALQRDLAASDSVQSAGSVPITFDGLKESSNLSGDDDPAVREVQRRIDAAEEEYIDRRALLNQHVIKAERALAAAVSYQQNIDPPARLGVPGASKEELINRVRDVVGTLMEADQDGRDALKHAVASTYKELWHSALQLTDVH